MLDNIAAPRLHRAVVDEAAQVVGQVGGGLIALRRLRGQGRQHHRFEVARHVGIARLRTHDARLHRLQEQSGRVRLVVGGLQDEQLIERQAKAKEVGAGVRSALEAFRGGIAEGAGHLAGTGEVVLIEVLGQAEVGDPYRAVVVEQQVGRLDVAVQDALGVGVGEGLGRLRAKAGDMAIIRRARSRGKAAPKGRAVLRPQPGEDAVESHAGDQLHDVVGQSLVFANAEHGHDVGVMQPGGGLCLAAEAFEMFGGKSCPAEQHLERHAPRQGALLGLIDDAHAAPADLADDAKIAQAFGQRFDGDGGDGRRSLEVFQQRDGGKEVFDLLGVLGMALGVFGDGGVLAGAVAGDELLGKRLDGVAVGVQVGHGLPPGSCRSGMAVRISLSRFSART